MITGNAPTGAITPPICAAAEIWQFRPICAHDPISACESINVFSPTNAPKFTNIGGMQITPRARCAASRMLDPPGTMRTPSCSENACIGYAALSKNGCLPAPPDISTTSLIRKPSRIPFFTQAFTRQPVGEDASGSAARCSPRLSAPLNAANNAKCSVVYAVGGVSNSASIRDGSMSTLDQIYTFQHCADARLIFRFGCNQRQP